MLYYVKRYKHQDDQDQDNHFASHKASHPGPQLPGFMILDYTIELNRSQDAEWQTPPDFFQHVLDEHVHFHVEGDEDMWLSSFSHKKRVRQFARSCLRECPDTVKACSIVKVRTYGDMMVYKATDLFRAFELDYDPTSFEGIGSIRLFKDEYLIAYKIPAEAIEYMRPSA